MSDKITVNGKDYLVADMDQQQNNMLTQLRLTEHIGEIMNQAHDALTLRLAHSLEADEDAS